jgi:hypothetical protein
MAGICIPKQASIYKVYGKRDGGNLNDATTGKCLILE